jgi:hypothetical protein
VVALVRGKTKATSRDWRRGGGARSRWCSTPEGSTTNNVGPSDPGLQTGMSRHAVISRAMSRHGKFVVNGPRDGRFSHTGRRPPDQTVGGPPEKFRATKRAFSKCRPGCAPGGGRFQVNCSRVGTRPLLETSVLRGSGSTPLGDVVPESVLLQTRGPATPPTCPADQETVHPRGHPARIATSGVQPRFR